MSLEDAEHEEEGFEGGDLFNEPADYFAPEKPPTFIPYDLQDGRRLNLRLVGHNPLWGHHLWNGARELAAHLQEAATHDLIEGATVLELGAGAGLPGLVAALMGALKVVLSDYPDPELVDNIAYNIRHAASEDLGASVEAVGYQWGAVDPPAALQQEQGFRLLFLADVNFNHSEHAKLADSVATLLSRHDPRARAWVFFTPYRPWLLERDMALFQCMVDRGLVVEKVKQRLLDRVMFEEDPGDEMLRRTVFCYEVRWPRAEEDPAWLEKGDEASSRREQGTRST